MRNAVFTTVGWAEHERVLILLQEVSPELRNIRFGKHGRCGKQRKGDIVLNAHISKINMMLDVYRKYKAY